MVTLQAKNSVPISSGSIKDSNGDEDENIIGKTENIIGNNRINKLLHVSIMLRNDLVVLSGAGTINRLKLHELFRNLLTGY